MADASLSPVGARLAGAAQVCIVGLGLIGGSLALALRKRLPQLRIAGIDRHAESQQPGAQATHRYCAEADAEAVARALGGSDLVVLATPVSEIQRWLPIVLAHRAIVTDCGSTKLDIANAAQASPGAARFVPGHPMAGASASAPPDPDLFVDRPWILCAEHAEASARTLVEELVTSVGAKPVYMSASEHDRAVAWTSHVPRIASSLITVLSERAQALQARGPAFERLLRSSGGSASIWADVLRSNAGEIAGALDQLGAELRERAQELRGGSIAPTLAAFDNADRVRQSLARESGSPPSRRR